MTKKIVALFLLSMLALPSFAALKGLDTAVKEESIVRVGENVIVPQGAEVKSAVSVGGSVTVAGKVQEDVVAIGGDVTLQDGATVGGDVVTVGGLVHKNPVAVIKGNIVEVKLPAAMVTKGLGWGLAFMSLLSFVAFLVLAVILAALFPGQLGLVSYYVERQPGHALLWGFLAVIATPAAILLLILTIFGIPFIPVLLLILGAAFVFGYVSISQLLGKLTLKAFKVRGKPMAIEVLTGLAILFIVGFLPILGWIIKAIAGLMGLGAVAVTKFGTRPNCC
jgi:hypothetical protein